MTMREVVRMAYFLPAKADDGSDPLMRQGNQQVTPLP